MDGKPGSYTMQLKSGEKIPVTVESLPATEYAKKAKDGPHGVDTGTALYTFELNPDGSVKEAKIFVNEDMKKADLQRVLQHEFEEVADIASQHLTSPEDIKAQTEANLFQPNTAATGEATAHDRAQARELARELKGIKQDNLAENRDLPPKDARDRLNELGFNNAAHLDEKLQLLEKAFAGEGMDPKASADLLRRIRTFAMSNELARMPNQGPEFINNLRQRIDALRTDQGKVDPAAFSKLMADLPTLKSDSAEDLKAFASQALHMPPEKLNIKRIKDIQAAHDLAAIGVSGADVSLIKDSDGHLLGVVKVFPPKQAQELATELSAMQKLNKQSFQSFKSIEALGAAKLQDGSGVIMLSPAKGISIDDMLIKLSRMPSGVARDLALAETKEAVRKNAIALAELHTKTVGSQANDAQGLDRHINATLEITNKIAEFTEKYNQAFANDEDQIKLDTTALRKRVAELIDEVRKTPGPNSLVHGDFHPGNMFYDKDVGITLIDSGRMHESMDSHGLPIGKPARDVEAFYYRLQIDGQKYGLEDPEIAELQKTFKETYDERGLHIPDAMQRFFQARTALGKLIEAMQRGDSSVICDQHLNASKKALNLP